MKAGARLLQALGRLLAGAAPQPAVLALPAPPAEPVSGPWRPLPGNVLELGASGFQIQLDVSPTKPLYTLRAPEGFACGWGGDLAGLKQLGERFARERDEFVCKPIEMRW